jgi:hypothetical protein
MQTTAMKYQNYIESEIERKVSAITSDIRKQIVLEEYQDYIEAEIERESTRLHQDDRGKV